VSAPLFHGQYLLRKVKANEGGKERKKGKKGRKGRTEGWKDGRKG